MAFSGFGFRIYFARYFLKLPLGFLFVMKLILASSRFLGILSFVFGNKFGNLCLNLVFQDLNLEGVRFSLKSLTFHISRTVSKYEKAEPVNRPR